MIRPEQVFLAVEPVDMRMGMDGLSLHVQQSLGRAPGSGPAFVFRNRRGNRIKLLVWDGTGVWLCLRRLHQGKFTWPKADDVLWQITAEQWQWLVNGVDWQRLSALPDSQRAI
jgi:transposase